MPKPTRAGKQLGLYVSEQTAAQLRALSDRTLIPQSKLLRRALELLFDEYQEARPKKRAKE